MSMSAEDYAAMMVPAQQQSSSVAAPPKKKVKSKLVTGFILYSQEVRKAIGQSNPDLGFGDISRVVGNEWKSLSGDERDVYVRRASKMNEEVKAKMMEERDSFGNLVVPEGNFNIRKMGGTANNAISKKKNKTSKFTGFILYSQEVRKNVRQNNPALGFGDISRIVGNDWTSLPGDEKQSWKDRATKMNETQQTMVL